MTLIFYSILFYSILFFSIIYSQSSLQHKKGTKWQNGMDVFLPIVTHSWVNEMFN